MRAGVSAGDAGRVIRGAVLTFRADPAAVGPWRAVRFLRRGAVAVAGDGRIAWRGPAARFRGLPADDPERAETGRSRLRRFTGRQGARRRQQRGMGAGGGRGRRRPRRRAGGGGTHRRVLHGRTRGAGLTRAFDAGRHQSGGRAIQRVIRRAIRPVFTRGFRFASGRDAGAKAG